MKTNFLLSAVLSCFFFAPLTVQANDKVDSTYNPQKYQQVCKGKKQGDAVSFAARGIIWNGTCQTQFIPSGNYKNIKGTEAELSSICKSDLNAKSINIEGKQYAGKCTLAYTAPAPAN
ncbi:hypothetical protein B9T31_12410 [Acinetobacter sp. ANC 4558]|uniref:hypothetical protein n=1 Tax=Acinetobacter sp. ANC 4558 TaxID=1977876 RepID=UPI000A340672|nr:hypothetical protein [Acinetobacter sp. ANC 4558]OTG85274.1 hypothetical protein B9T31_12410 [Acinetobacter sp. ANC 4558]